MSEVQELRGATSRQDAEVRQLREENRGLAQKAALAGTLGADCASLQQRVSRGPVSRPGLCLPSHLQLQVFLCRQHKSRRLPLDCGTGR